MLSCCPAFVFDPCAQDAVDLRFYQIWRDRYERFITKQQLEQLCPRARCPCSSACRRAKWQTVLHPIDHGEQCCAIGFAMGQILAEQQRLKNSRFELLCVEDFAKQFWNTAEVIAAV